MTNRSLSLAWLAVLLLWLRFPTPNLAACPFSAGSLGELPENEMDSAPADAASWTPPRYSNPSNCTATDFERIAREVVEFARQNASIPRLLRLGVYSCLTHSASGRSGGCSGAWHQYPVDYEHAANAGLKPLILALREQRAKRWPCITFSDLVTLGASVAVEAAGGPQIAWLPGRLDALSPGPSAPAYSARLPSGDFSSAGVLYFYTNLGLTVREAVALTGGGHSLGSASVSSSGYNGTFTPSGDTWPTPKNRFFVDLATYGWQCVAVPGSEKVQYVPLAAPGQEGAASSAPNSSRTVRLPSDMALRTSKVLSYWAVTYALKEGAFISDFQRAMQRVLQLGAGITWKADTSYQWKGLGGTFAGFGPSIPPQLDTTDLPMNGAPAEWGSLITPLADPSKPYPTG